MHCQETRSGRTAAEMAARFKYDEVVDLLVDAGASPPVRRGSGAQTARGARRSEGPFLKPLSTSERKMLGGVLGLTPR